VRACEARHTARVFSSFANQPAGAGRAAQATGNRCGACHRAMPSIPYSGEWFLINSRSLYHPHLAINIATLVMPPVREDNQGHILDTAVSSGDLRCQGLSRRPADSRVGQLPHRPCGLCTRHSSWKRPGSEQSTRMAQELRQALALRTDHTHASKTRQSESGRGRGGRGGGKGRRAEAGRREGGVCLCVRACVRENARE